MTNGSNLSNLTLLSRCIRFLPFKSYHHEYKISLLLIE
jgi:hypothetical protein